MLQFAEHMFVLLDANPLSNGLYKSLDVLHLITSMETDPDLVLSLGNRRICNRLGNNVVMFEEMCRECMSVRSMERNDGRLGTARRKG